MDLWIQAHSAMDGPWTAQKAEPPTARPQPRKPGLAPQPHSPYNKSLRLPERIGTGPEQTNLSTTRHAILGDTPGVNARE